jgi:integral membrane protein
MNFSTKLGQLRILAIAEGISYLLFALTMPIKYMLDNPMPNKIVGMAHGVLFIAYCLWVIFVAFEKKWTFKTTLLAGFASLIPFGTFIADSKIFKKS